MIKSSFDSKWGEIVKIICKETEKVKLQKVHYGDFVYLDAGDSGAISHWAIMTISEGLVGCDAGSTMLSSITCDRDLHLGDHIQYWQITKIATLVEVKECISL